MDYRPARMLAFVIKRLLLLGTLTMATPAIAGISFVGAGTVSTNGQPTFPSGKLTNDILVAVCGRTTVTPTGWTLAVGSTDGKFRVFWRRSSSDTAPNFGSGARCRMAAYRGAVATGSPFEAVGAVAQASDPYTAYGIDYTGPAPASITTLTSNASVLQASYAWCSDIETCRVSTAAGGPAPTVAFGESTGYDVVGLNHGLKQSPGATGSGAKTTVLEFQDTGEYAAYSALLALRP